MVSHSCWGGCLGSVERLLELCGWGVVAVAVEPLVVEPVDPAHRLDLVDVVPHGGGIGSTDALGLVQTVGRLRQGVVVGVGDGADGGAGADLGRLHEPDYNPSANAVRALMALKKPLVAAVEGDAIGFGATMLLHADFIYAGQSARFRFPFVDLGIAPEAGSSQILVQQLGRVRAAELLLGAEAAEAAKLLEYGLINDVTETGGALARAAAMAAALAAKPRESLVETKRLMRREAEPLDARVAEEFRAVGRRVGSEEAQAIFAAFFTRKS